MIATWPTPELYPLSPGRPTGMRDRAGAEVLEGDEVLYFNVPKEVSPEPIRGVIRRCAWSRLSPKVADGWVVAREDGWFAGITAEFSATEHGVRKIEGITKG